MMSDSDLSDDIVQSELPQHVLPSVALRTDFKPWHRVRKQFIRERQWNPAIRYLTQRYLRRELQSEETPWTEPSVADIEQVGTSVPEDIRIERPLRCFLLPADDLLEVRCLWKELQNEGCYFKFLGFNKSLRDAEYRRRVDVAESAVTQLSRMCKDSQVTADTFQDIGRSNTQAFRLFRQYGPYDVVNLDICDSLVPRGIGQETQASYTALHQVLRYQLERQKTPWLLFATTQVDRATANQPEINKLAKPTRDNCDGHPAFAAELAKIIPDSTFRGDAHVLDISPLTATQLVQVFGIFLGKWLVSVLANASPRCTVKLLTSYRYVVEASTGVEMLSLGFIIAPHFTPPVDVVGISILETTVRPFPSELETALQIVSIAMGIRNVDEILNSDGALRNQLINAKADLLAACGYDRDAYLHWVESGEREPAC
jgi:hypothetical protein